MFACLAAVGLAAAPFATIAPLADTVSREAGELRATVSMADQPAYQAELRAFSNDAMALSAALREAGLTDDLPCIFKGISEDALVKAELVARSEPSVRPIVESQLAALLDDAILMAPMAAKAARDAQGQR